MIKGSIPALITPFKNGEIDKNALEDLVEWQIEEGSNGLVAVGTTGESPTLSHEAVSYTHLTLPTILLV